jgi:hypothetical protein
MVPQTLFRILPVLLLMAWNGCFETFSEQHQLITSENIVYSIKEDCFPTEAFSIDPKIAEYDSIKACLESDSVHQCQVIRKGHDWERLYFTSDKFSPQYKIKYQAYWKKYLFDSATFILPGKTRDGHKNIPGRVEIFDSSTRVTFRFNYGDSAYYSNIVIDGKPYTQVKGIDYFGLGSTVRFSDYSLSLPESLMLSKTYYGSIFSRQAISGSGFTEVRMTDDTTFITVMEIQGHSSQCYVSKHNDILYDHHRMKYGQDTFTDSQTGAVKTVLYKYYDETGARIQFPPIFTFPYGYGSTLFIKSDSTGYICRDNGGSDETGWLYACTTHAHVIH